LDPRCDEKISAIIAHLQERAEEEEEAKKDLCADLPPPMSSSKRNEAIQWLLQDPRKYPGAEQLWVKSWTYLGFTEGGANLRERTTSFSLSAGSLEDVNGDHGTARHIEYCIDGTVVARREAEMALQDPGLWAHKYNLLRMKQLKPADVYLRPAFEFFPSEDIQTSRKAEAHVDSNFLRAKNVPRDPRSAFALVKAWLSACLQNHRRCDRGYSVAPIRLIRVLTGDGKPIVQLVDSLDIVINESLLDIRWGVLSHSWGTDRSIISTLTLAKMEHMRRSIDELTLCPSFQDAITIARGLNLQFIWIDAMCIIQDSPEDWNVESSRMSDYYEGSQIMISALSSSSASDRMLHTRDYGPLATVVVDGNRLGVRRLLRNAVSVTPYLRYYWSAREHITAQPLSKRAWTFLKYTMDPASYTSPKNRSYGNALPVWLPRVINTTCPIMSCLRRRY
jgi:hypothetical protein